MKLEKNSPLISVIMEDTDFSGKGQFREHNWLKECWLNQSLPKDQYEIIWVSYQHNPDCKVKDLEGIRYFCLNLSGKGSKPRSINEGIRRSNGAILIIADGDVACDFDLLENIKHEFGKSDELALYIPGLDQEAKDHTAGQSFERLKKTCRIMHTFNYGRCICVRREDMIRMNGYEELDLCSGYFMGGDNYLRFKNMGLKIKWHPVQRVYHAHHAHLAYDKSHPYYRKDLFEGSEEELDFLRQRAAKWDWMAYSGLDAKLNRPYDPGAKVYRVMTERGYTGAGRAGR